jgi:allophanate hydrolase subunit 1
VARPSWNARLVPSGGPQDAVLARTEASGDRPTTTYRQAGDRFVLVELGEMALDLELRLRVHALDRWAHDHLGDGLVDVTPGVRSLLVQVDGDRLTVPRALAAMRRAEEEVVDVAEQAFPARTVHLPLSWDDPATREAIDRYVTGVRPDAPWCPWNIEFIRRVNGLDTVEDVRRTVLDASYLVLGLGDVYLGAPVATPIDPRHRLVTTKYNPARTWTPENAVGIGGAYLCIYGMEGPGGYQLVGRTVQVWNRHRRGPALPRAVAAAPLRPAPVVPRRGGRAAGDARPAGGGDTCRCASRRPLPAGRPPAALAAHARTSTGSSGARAPPSRPSGWRGRTSGELERTVAASDRRWRSPTRTTASSPTVRPGIWNRRACRQPHDGGCERGEDRIASGAVMPLAG